MLRIPDNENSKPDNQNPKNGILTYKKKQYPKDPGVYIFKDSLGNVIYVGKAKSLRERLASYFSNRPAAPLIELLKKKIFSIEHISVDNEVEALLLENKLIKKHTPKFNVNLKDSKTYAYIKLTPEPFPRIMTARNTKGKGEYYGPYTDGFGRRRVMELAIKAFKLRTCVKLPKKACLNYHIGICTAPCIGNVTKEEYNLQVDSAREFLDGDNKGIKKKLRDEMAEASQFQKYEVALERRRQLESIDELSMPQKVDLIKDYDQDLVAFLSDLGAGRAAASIISIRKGVILGKKEFRFELSENLLEEFIKTYYSMEQIPREIIVNTKFWESDDDRNVIEQYLERLRGAKVTLTLPQKGEKMALIKLAEKNCEHALGGSPALADIQLELNLPTLPETIECFDVSNLGREHIVGAMSRWVNGTEDKRGYRRFEIRSFDSKADDYAAISEVIYRRYKRVAEEKTEMPSLIMIDGGPGQLNAALSSLQRLGLSIPIVSLAKKNEELYLPHEQEPRVFPKNSRMMLLLRKIRDSVHRFAIFYNRKKREMRFRKDISS